MRFLHSSIIGTVLLLCSIVLVTTYFWHRGSFLRSLPSPDGRYTLEVWKEYRFFSMPGDGSSGPGWLRLRDDSGTLLREQHVDIANAAAMNVQWEPCRVSFDYPDRDLQIAQWPLVCAENGK